MQPFRFLHTADLHLGTPFQGLGKHVPARWLQHLRNASFEVFARIVDVAIREQVQFVTIAGDLFDAADVPMAVQFELQRGFTRLRDHDIAVFVCHGNHDPLPMSRPLQWPDNVHVFEVAPQLLTDDYVVPSVYFQPREGTTVQLSGFSYGSPEIHHSLAEYFTRDTTADFGIALYHGVVGPAGGHANYCATRLQTVMQQNFDFWGLGHIHKPEIIRAEHPTVLYPGNPQGRHIREDGARGVWVVDVNELGRVSLRTISTATIAWQKVGVDIDGAESLDDVQNQVIAALKEAVQQQAGEACVVRVTLYGNTALHSYLTDSDEWETSLQDEVEYHRLPVLIEKMDVRTSPLLDVETLKHSEEFIGEFLRLVDAWQVDVDTSREKLSSVLADVFHARNELSVQDMTDEDIHDLLDGVRRLVLKYLTAEEVAG